MLILRPLRRLAWLLPALSCLLILLTQGCAQLPHAAATQALLDDALMVGPGQPAEPFDPDSLFAMSPAMLDYAQRHLRPASVSRDPRRALIDALYNDDALRMRYHPARTHTAAEAFAARSGNCLSLVVMTAAFAKHLGLPVSYRRVLVEDSFTREGSLTLASGHVNLVLSTLPHRTLKHAARHAELEPLMVDFLPPEELRGQQSVPLQEHTLAAMVMNNRSAAALQQGELRQAYARSRDALQLDPAFVPAINTLGVIYLRAGHARHAEAAFRQALARDGDNRAALSNLIGLLQDSGRAQQAAPWVHRLAALQPVPPFHHHDLGRKALAAGDPAGARDHLQRELRLQPDHPDVHFLLAQAWLQLGDARQAARHLARAQAASPSLAQQARFGAKLKQLKQSHRL